MEYARLGRTGLEVSRLCLGTMNWGWTASEQDSRAVMDAFVEAGGNFLDTADMYSRWAEGNPGGVAEEIIGRWLKDRGNGREMVIATKVCGPMGEGPNHQGLSRKHIMEAAEDSLRRLQTDYIDLYQAHWDDLSVPLEETLRAFDDLVRQGKVLYIGASNYSAWRLGQALAASDAHGWVRYVALQPHYNLVQRTEFEPELQALCEQQGIGVIPYSPLAGGFLTGKYGRGQPLPTTERAERVQEHYFSDQRAWRVLGAVEAVAQAHAGTVSQVALAWLLSQAAVVAPIIGANTPAQLQESLGSLSLELSQDDMGRLDAASRPGDEQED